MSNASIDACSYAFRLFLIYCTAVSIVTFKSCAWDWMEFGISITDFNVRHQTWTRHTNKWQYRFEHRVWDGENFTVIHLLLLSRYKSVITPCKLYRVNSMLFTLQFGMLLKQFVHFTWLLQHSIVWRRCVPPGKPKKTPSLSYTHFIIFAPH